MSSEQQQQQDDTHSVGSLSRLDATRLSYTEMTMDPSGSIMSREVKMEWRQKLGYCTTCPERPVLLYKLKKSRLNLLLAAWSSNKQPRSVPGECENGVCLRCQRAKQQQAQEQLVPTTRQRASAPTTAPNGTTASTTTTAIGGGYRQLSNSTLGSTAPGNGGDYFSRSNSSNSLRVTSQQQQQQQQLQQQQQQLHHHSSAFHGHHHHHQRAVARRNSHSSSNSNNNMLGMSMHSRAAILPRSSDHHHQQQHQHQHHSHLSPTGSIGLGGSYHYHPGTVAEHEPLAVPALISSSQHQQHQHHQQQQQQQQRRVMADHRQLSTTDFSVISTLSNDWSVVSSEGDNTETSNHNGTTTTTPMTTTTMLEHLHASNGASRQRLSSSRIDDSVLVDAGSVTNNSTAAAAPEHLRVLLADVQSDSRMLIEVVTNIMASDEKSEGVQILCLEAIMNAHIEPTLLIHETDVRQGVFRAMKNHQRSLRLQQVALKLLLLWSEDDDLRPILIHHGVCDHILRILNLHPSDSIILEDALGLLRLVTLENEAREFCQNHKVSELIAEYMGWYPRQSSIQTDACAVLNNLAINDVEQKVVGVVSHAVLHSVTTALLMQLDGRPVDTDWSVVKSACFTIKSFLHHEANKRALARRGELLEALEELVKREPRRCKHAVVILEKLQVSRVKDESLQTQILEALQHLWHKPIPTALDEILLVWKEHGSWSATILVASLHQIQDMWQQAQNCVGAERVERILVAASSFAEHPDPRVRIEMERLRALLTEGCDL